MLRSAPLLLSSFKNGYWLPLVTLQQQIFRNYVFLKGILPPLHLFIN